MVAIASRKLAKARAAAEQFGISNAHGFYEELLADPNVEAVFNPLPNHLHVPWSIQAARAGKHVLCEKPIGLGALLGTKARIDVEVPVNAPLDTRNAHLSQRLRGEKAARISTPSRVSYFRARPWRAQTCIDYLSD